MELLPDNRLIVSERGSVCGCVIIGQDKEEEEESARGSDTEMGSILLCLWTDGIEEGHTFRSKLLL